MHGILALLERSLRLDSRQISLHLQRLLVVGIIYFCAVTFTNSFNVFGAPGLRFFTDIAYVNAVVMMFFGVQTYRLSPTFSGVFSAP